MSIVVAKYLRLSSEDADLKLTGKAESNSISNQRDLLDSYIAHSPDLAGAAVAEFCDDGWSGKNFERPAFQEMLSQAKQGKIQCIIVKDMSRFGRDYLMVGNYISRVFPFLGVRFIAVNDGVDSIRAADVDSLDTSFKALIYDLYSRDLSRKVRSAKRFRAERGDFMSPFAPFGYIKDPANPKRLMIDPDAAKVVRRIFRMMAEGQRTDEIAKALNREAVPTPMLYKRLAGCSRAEWPSVNGENFWTRRMVSKLLRDERYIGKCVYGKRTRDRAGNCHTVKVHRTDWVVVTDTHDEIVTREEFDRAQAAMKAFEERSGAAEKRSVLCRKVYCGICGHAMSRRGRKSIYFRCMTPMVTDAYACPAEAVPEEDILDMVMGSLRTQVEAAVELSRIWEEQQRQEKNGCEITRKSLTLLQETLHRQERQIQALYESFALGEISREEYLAQRTAAVKQRDALAEQIGRMEDSLRSINSEGGAQSRFAETDGKYQAVPAITAEIIEDVLERLVVWPDRRIEIVWKYQEDFMRLARDIGRDDSSPNSTLFTKL